MLSTSITQMRQINAVTLGFFRTSSTVLILRFFYMNFTEITSQNLQKTLQIGLDVSPSVSKEQLK